MGRAAVEQALGAKNVEYVWKLDDKVQAQAKTYAQHMLDLKQIRALPKFDTFLNLPAIIQRELPPREDPISKYLDAIDRKLGMNVAPLAEKAIKAVEDGRTGLVVRRPGDVDEVVR